MARMTIEKYQNVHNKSKDQLVLYINKKTKKDETMIQMAFRNLNVSSSRYFSTNALGITSIKEKCVI
jgi:hypothetical protein